MSQNTLKLTSRVIDQANRLGIAGLRVEVQRGAAKASAVTDERGAFTITFDQSDHPNLFKGKSREITLTLKVFKGRKLIKTTREKIPRNGAQGKSKLEIEVSMPEARVTAPDSPKSSVKGRVTYANGEPFVKGKVAASDRDLRDEQSLGECTLDEAGGYEIFYSRKQFRRREKGAADLIVRVFDNKGTELIASQILFNAPTTAQIDLTVPADKLAPPSLFERINAAFDPLLASLKIEDLEEDQQHQDVSFLSGETRIEKNDIARFIIAHKLALQAIQPEFWFVLLGGESFHFAEGKSLNDQLTGVLDALPSFDAVAVRKALTRGFNLQEIPDALKQRADEWLATFLEFAASHTIREAAQATFIKSALNQANIADSDRQMKFARLMNEHRSLTPTLLDELKKDFTEAEVADLITSYQLADLTQSDFSLVNTLKDAFDIRQPESIRQLARLSEREWVDFIAAHHEAGRINLQLDADAADGGKSQAAAEDFAKKMERQFRTAFPTAAFTGELSRALNNGGARGLRHAEALNEFLNHYQDFDLLNSSLDDFMNKSIQPQLAALAENEDFKLEVKAVQRVFKLTPTFAATDTLLADNLHSAQQIYRMGETEFVRRYADSDGFTAEDASLAWRRAADTHAAVLTLVGDLKALEAEGLPLALQNSNEAISQFPNWENLFQAGDLCECDHCRSVLSPAAYYADLLMFLKGRGANGGSVKDILLDPKRRPDLGYLELNCENALTPLPYIDVVCEVLEAVVADGSNDLELTGFASMPSDATAAKVAVAAAFAAKQINLGAAFSVTQVISTDTKRWVVHGDDTTYLLKKKTTANFFAEILRNTKASADELRAYPQYVNPKAYEILESASYPLTLPFALFAEEVRAAFQKTNLQRWDLMRVLRGNAAPNNPTDGEIAAEYFGIGVKPPPAIDEKRLILVENATEQGQQTVWGESKTDWLNEVAKVKTFLGKTGLEYNELLALLDLKFINPTGDIKIHHQDASCDTKLKDIEALDVTKLDRIHRFLRLWRKLKGWKMWQLDLVIRHPAIGNNLLDEIFLINLMYLVEFKNRLGSSVTIEQAAALLGDINTTTHFTELHKKRDAALYQTLFLNKKLTNPLDSAFEIDPTTGDLAKRELIKDHKPVVLSALRISEADLALLQGLTPVDIATAYVSDDKLKLSNLSFLWRHAKLAGLLKLKAEEWKNVLKRVAQPKSSLSDLTAKRQFLQENYIRAASLEEAEVDKLISRVLYRDLFSFACPKSALEFLEKINQIKDSGFSDDELNWVLAADRSAKSAVKETDAARFLAGLGKDLQVIRAEYDPAKYPFLQTPTDADRITALLNSLLQRLNRDDAATLFFVSVLSDEVNLEARVPGLDSSFVDFESSIKKDIPIRYDKLAAKLRFRGLMTTSQRTTLLNNTGVPEVIRKSAVYQAGIEELYNVPRLALKFFEPVFINPLAQLPAEVDFNSLSSPLAQKITYDSERRLLRFAGIMLRAEQEALKNLSTNADYRGAVDRLFGQAAGSFPAEKLWLQDTDLQFPLRDLKNPAKDHLAANLATAARKALAYLLKSLSEGIVIQQASSELGLTEAMTRKLFTFYALLPENLLSHLTRVLAAATGPINYDLMKTTFDGWYWANRAATILKKWKITLEDLERLIVLTDKKAALSLLSLPLDNQQTAVPINLFLQTSRLVRLRDSLPDTKITFFAVLEKLISSAYSAANFSADVEMLNDAWQAADVKELVNSLDLTYPNDYFLAESWERLRRIFYFIGNLNASAAIVKTFAAASMKDSHAKTLKEIMRSKFGTETWLTLSADIQDALRERKRDALAAYLLSKPKPDDAPSGKWENTNDLYAYYLLDIEMSPCQLTSRLVQASGSVQLLVQRCFMGLEPKVAVKSGGLDGDSGWRWWKWMSKYRVWEANRKVFLWPENWIEPELRKDRSPFFKDLESELLQDEINQHTVETVFSNYLAKLDGVAQLEISAFYQEDDGDNTILHLFGRTAGAEPHLYYYRRYDYRQWTPWEKVDIDIQGDYLIPGVVDHRLFLFWPVFTEIPDEAVNREANVPNAGDKVVPMKKTAKRLKVQMAVSEYIQGTWTPKRVSKDFELAKDVYTEEVIKDYYQFLLTDQSVTSGRFSIKSEGQGLGSVDGHACAKLNGAFEISKRNGVPERSPEESPGFWDKFMHSLYPEPISVGGPKLLRWVEGAPRIDRPADDLTVRSHFATQDPKTRKLLGKTPGNFKVLPAWQLSYFDKIWLDGLAAPDTLPNPIGPFGTWLPFFYSDERRTFFVLPVSIIGPTRDYYPWFKKFLSDSEAKLEGDLRKVTALPDAAKRETKENEMYQAFPAEQPPPYTDPQLMDLMVRFEMRKHHGNVLKAGAHFMRRFELCQFHFKNFYHPFVRDFARLVFNSLLGIPALMSRETQLKDSGFRFYSTYSPTNYVEPVLTQMDSPFFPKEVVDFSPDGAYSSYNWELFFHAPLLIANQLSKNQRFEEAREWYHFIFNPIGVDPPAKGGSPMSKYWITKPFYETMDPHYIQQRIENLMRILAGDRGVPEYSSLVDQVNDWRTHPFEPNRIANYRTVAYQKTVVMKYLDNLIAWGDYLFRQDSIESINEATQLYILAAEILGPRPRKMPPQKKPPLETFNELEEKLDAFSNALVQVENLIPPLAGQGLDGADAAPLPTLYFCIPQNDKLLGYWDTVADRLYKIRHCMNIEGVARQLALFEPPIDPAVLVKASALGVDISSALADLNAPLPLYRFNVLLQKANEVCNDVKVLGSALLTALEKKDAEELSQIRQGHEVNVLEAVKAVREKQVDEAQRNLDALRKSKIVVETRRDYYRKIEFINACELQHLAKLEEANKNQLNALDYSMIASIAHAVPNFSIGFAGFGGSPNASVSIGGSNVGSSLQAYGAHFSWKASARGHEANRASILGNYLRRWNDWKQQENLADKELEQIDKSIAAAEIHLDIARKELDNQILQISNARATDDFMRSKYTNKELYQWQVGQISNVYFQSYKLAYDLAKRAERCFRFELGLQDSSYINFGYWDSLKKGLLAGEKLQYDLRRLEAAYIEHNRREFELTKHVSLALLDPLALVKLRETGRCFFSMPEEIFDLDFPGHYFRRIKSVSVTLPCVVGPYTTISCTLRLLKNYTRINTALIDGYAHAQDESDIWTDDTRFVESNIPVKAIAASNAQNDSGVFELSFRDERYLPFEGAGVISQWLLELFNDSDGDFGKSLRQFDYNTISDAIVHVKYTAREDAGRFKQEAIGHLRKYFEPTPPDNSTPSFRSFNLRQEFPTQWHRFLYPEDPAKGNVFELEMEPSLFGIRDVEKTLKVNRIWLMARCADPGDYTVVTSPPLPPPPKLPTQDPNEMKLTRSRSSGYGDLHFSQKNVGDLNIEVKLSGPPDKWLMRMRRPGGENLREDLVKKVMEVDDVILVLGYEWS